MKFCAFCGGPLSVRVPQGDDRPRHVCDACGEIHYQNPKVVTGCIPVWQDKVLLCRRAIEPRFGLWTLPAGYMELGESVQEGAAREAREEANARVRILDLYTTLSLPHINQVYMMFRAELLDLDFAPGTESLEVALFGEAEVPWSRFAFPVVAETLRFWFSDRVGGVFRPRTGEIRREQVDGERRFRMELL